MAARTTIKGTKPNGEPFTFDFSHSPQTPTAEISRRFEFSAAHYLPNHRGKCAHLHGHNYVLNVTIHAPIQPPFGFPSEGMVWDFQALKEVVNRLVVNVWDHAFLASGTEPLLPAIKDAGHKVAHIGLPTTAENLALVAGRLLMADGVPVVRVEVQETPNSSAVAFPQWNGSPSQDLTHAAEVLTNEAVAHALGIKLEEQGVAQRGGTSWVEGEHYVYKSPSGDIYKAPLDVL